MEENCPVEADLIRPALDAVWARLTMLQRAQLLVTALRIERGEPEPTRQRRTGPLKLTAENLRLLDRFWNFYEAHAARLNHSRRMGVIALRLDECEKVAAEEDYSLPVSELAGLLPLSTRHRFMAGKVVASRLTKRAVRCLVFRAGEPDLFSGIGKEARQCD
ncbi:hypothetical protein [Victivallis vadensis]|uniref:hypothetical protein n=1 Tax=Victivallis vadensis TaxID=172901 RepID=UPI003D073A0B